MARVEQNPQPIMGNGAATGRLKREDAYVLMYILESRDFG